MSSTLTPSAYAFVKESFNNLDEEGKGEVSKQDVKAMMQTLGIPDKDDQKLDEMMTTSSMKFSEYLEMMSSILSTLSFRDELSFMFDQFKTNGKLNTNELKKSLISQGLSETEISDVFRKFTKFGPNGEQFDDEKFVKTMSI